MARRNAGPMRCRRFRIGLNSLMSAPRRERVVAAGDHDHLDLRVAPASASAVSEIASRSADDKAFSGGRFRRTPARYRFRDAR